VRRRPPLTSLRAMAATLVATCFLFAALLPLARQDLRDIALPSLRVDVGFSSPAPTSPTAARRRRPRAPAIARAETVVPSPSTESNTRNAVDGHAGVETAPATSPEFGPEPAAAPFVSRLAVDTEWLTTAELVTGAPPKASAAIAATTAVSSNPALFRRMYLTLGLLQAGDVLTTTVALNAGATEANRVMRGVVDSPARLIAVKATSTLAIAYLIERLRKRNPVSAAVTLAAIDSALAMVVMHNSRVIMRLRKTTILESP
jgi:hypothetical protein